MNIYIYIYIYYIIYNIYLNTTCPPGHHPNGNWCTLPHPCTHVSKRYFLTLLLTLFNIIARHQKRFYVAYSNHLI